MVEAVTEFAWRRIVYHPTLEKEIVVNRVLIAALCLALVALSWAGFGRVPATQAASTFTAVLNGAQQVPPNASPGTGTATVVLSSDQTTITVNVSFSGLTAPTTASHIHQAAAGTNGPVVIPFPTFPTGVTSGTFAGTFPITPALVSALEAGNLYVNIHTPNFPGGEIRGQLSLSVPPTPQTKDDCKHGGYKSFTDPSTGEPFKNQGQCVSFVNHQGKNK
jgi:hypothetical protein